MKPIIYLSGPITGTPQNNYPEFKKVEERMNAVGLKVLVPHDFFEGMDTSEFKHNDYMRICIEKMMKATLIVTLKGWEDSVGCKMEINIARELNIPVQPVSTFFANQKHAN